jgi:hypothetical protein
MMSLTAAGRATRSRAGAVLLGVLVALAVWAVLEIAMGDLRQPAFGGDSPRQLGAGVVALASLLGGLLGWAALVVTERVFRRGPRTWLAVVVAGLILSFGGPMSGVGVGTGDRLALALMHVAVAAVVIPLLYRTAVPSASPGSEEDR